MSFFFHIIKHPYVQFPFPEIYLRKIEIKMISVLAKSPKKGLNDNLRVFESIEQSRDIILAKTCDEIKGKYIDYLSFMSKKIVTLGLLAQDTNADKDEQNEIIQWLSKKDQSSIVFACFGSEYFLSKEQMEEIAHGLGHSSVNFVWVIRFPVGGERMEMEEVVPKGFLERIRKRGMVVEGWAPQAKNLGHPSIGGRVSHCGWSSTMESMKFGVPIIGMPMQLGQPLNARLAVEVGVGVEVMKDENGEFKREELASVIKEVAVEKSGNV